MKTNYGKGFLFALILALAVNTASVSCQTAILSFEGINKTASTTMPERTVFDQGSESVEVEYLFPGMHVSDVIVDQVGYHFLFIEGFSKMDQVGSPAMPAHNDQIAIPLNADVRITILEAESLEYDGYMIHPALEPAIDTYGAPDPEFVINEKIYNTDAYFPDKIVDIIDIQTLKECPIGIVQIRPVQFNPVTGTIKVYSKIKYKLEFISGSSFGAVDNSVRSNGLIKRIILNPASIPEGTTAGSTRAEGKDYIIITHSEYQAAADTLANWKRQKGYSVEVVSQSSWTSAQVKDAIHSRYASWSPHPDYFVIIGDHDGSYAVPGEFLVDSAFVSDLYYACMDGANDYFPDMAHGRISVTSATQAMDVVLKMVNYERFPVTISSFYSNGVNCAYFQDNENDGYASRRFTHTSEDIRDYVMSKGFSVERIYKALSDRNPAYYNNGYYSDGQPIPYEITRDAGFAWDGGAADITASIDAGKFYVFHRDHGYTDGSGWAHPFFRQAYINTLTNGDLLPVVFSINCHTGKFLFSQCFAEKFIRYTEGGAVGVIAAANTSFSGPNDGFSCGAFDAIWSDPGLIPDFGSGGIHNPNPTPHGDIFTMGDVMNQALLRMTETWGTHIRTFELYHYFGDPAMEIWTGEPVPITANIPGTSSGNSITITGSSCDDALATAFYDGALIGKTQLENGSGTITYSRLENNTEILITLSKHNFRPLMGTSISDGSVTYCQSSGNSTANEWIQTMAIGTYTNNSGDNGGYLDNTTNPVLVESGQSYSFTGTPGFSNRSRREFWRVWIDINADGDFTDAGEEVFAADGKKGTVSGSISIPAGLTGWTVMRVSMKYNAAPDPCEQIPYGEVEDYQLTFTPPTPQPPVADFSGDPTSLYEGETVQFTDLSSNNPTSWSWSFPGGTPSTSTIQNPLITYNTAGTYSVTLTATNGDGSDTHTKTDYMTVSLYIPQPPVADFSGSPTTLFEGETVQFTDLSSNDPTEWSWSFPGGTPSTSTVQNPVITYNSEGVYSVTLTATNAQGTDIYTKTDYITVNQQGSVTYCTSQSNSNDLEWIAQVDIDGFSNPSSASLYSDFTGLTVDLTPGSSSNVVLTPGYSGKSQREFYRIWIDFNGDGDFEDAGEQVFVANNKKDAVSSTMSIPSSATGQTRMRISMKNGSSPGPCEIFFQGEVEDYTVNFMIEEQEGISRTYNRELVIFPNPNNGSFQVILDEEIHPEARLKVYDMKGMLLYDIPVSQSFLELDLSGLSVGIYQISVINGNEYYHSKLVKQ